MNLFLFYPIEKCLLFMRETDWEMHSHLFRIGPIAFAVIWRRRRSND